MCGLLAVVSGLVAMAWDKPGDTYCCTVASLTLQVLELAA